jgi:hypothetical protein
VAKVLTPHERRELVTGKKSFKDIIAARPVKAPAAPSAPAAAAAPAAAPAEPAAAAPAAAPAPTVEPTAAAPQDPQGDPNADDGKTPDRFRFKDPVDATIALIAKTKGVSLIEATRIYQAENGTAPAAATPTPATPAAPAADPTVEKYDADVKALETRIKALSEERKKAREDVEMEKADSLSDEIAELKSSKILLENERQGYVRNREQAVVHNVQQQVTASKDRAVADYAELATEGSMHRLALDAYVARAIEDPKRAATFADPNWPEKLTAEFAAQYGLKKKGAAPAAPAAPATPPARAATPTTPPAPTLRPKVQQVPGAKLNTGSDGVQPSAPSAATFEDLRAALPRMTPAQRRELATRAARQTR